MKEMLRSVASCLLVLTLVAFGYTAAVTAQNRESRFISAKAGGVNLVSGDVTLRKATETGVQPLTAKDSLVTGDVVKTGSGGRAEILLSPGSYIRLAENSEFELTDASLDDLRLKLTKGSAVLEATGFSDVETAIMIETPQTEVSIIRSGIYRVNILPPDTTEVVVRKGRAVLGGNKAAPIKGDKKARVVGSAVEVVKYNKKLEKDAFDDWSKERAETLAEANRKLSNRSVNTLLASYRMNGLWSAGYQPRGLWLYDSGFGCYTFLPFYSRWSSPYGRSYNNMLYGHGYNGYGYGNNNTNQNDGRLVMTNSQSVPSNGGGNMGGNPGSNPGMSNPGGTHQPDPISRPQPTFDQPRSMPVDRGVDRGNDGGGGLRQKMEPIGGRDAQRPRDQ